MKVEKYYESPAVARYYTWFGASKYKLRINKKMMSTVFLYLESGRYKYITDMEEFGLQLWKRSYKITSGSIFNGKDFLASLNFLPVMEDRKVLHIYKLNKSMINKFFRNVPIDQAMEDFLNIFKKRGNTPRFEKDQFLMNIDSCIDYLSKKQSITAFKRFISYNWEGSLPDRFISGSQSLELLEIMKKNRRAIYTAINIYEVWLDFKAGRIQEKTALNQVNMYLKNMGK